MLPSWCAPGEGGGGLWSGAIYRQLDESAARRVNEYNIPVATGEAAALTQGGEDENGLTLKNPSHNNGTNSVQIWGGGGGGQHHCFIARRSPGLGFEPGTPRTLALDIVRDEVGHEMTKVMACLSI